MWREPISKLVAADLELMLLEKLTNFPIWDFPVEEPNHENSPQTT